MSKMTTRMYNSFYHAVQLTLLSLKTVRFDPELDAGLDARYTVVNDTGYIQARSDMAQMTLFS